MNIIADLQLHSKYARAVSQEMVIPKMWEWGKRKGIGILATGDWTHPLWMREIKTYCEEMGNGLLKLKNHPPVGGSNIKNEEDGPYFLLESEVSCIYSQGGKARRIHTLIWAPTVESAEKINKELTRQGANLMSDGRPIIGLTSIEVCDIVFSIDPKCLIIPAHIWTPWFSLYGSESGFDSISEAYGRFAKDIYAVETGLSSDPAMNWRIKELDTRAIVSFSDAHSGPKLGREATVFDLHTLSFDSIREALKQNSEAENRIAYTIEFYPEEGKYHYTGHRNCDVKQTPSQTREKGTLCPVCGRKLTVGVMHRVEELAGRTEEELKIIKRELGGTKMEGIYSETFPNRPSYVMMVPLQEILSEAIGTVPTSVTTQNEYKKLTDHLGGEFHILLQKDLADIAKVSGERVAQSIEKVRKGNIVVDPGYDGVFGIVKIWGNEKEKEEKDEKEQLSLFG
ncbi:DNA helicase UvrD [Candidatus Gottesmanbacteria bacterium]|nr:DNA helicase UvrD [Candidatus Gottesmanbacteria bacterium]